MADADPNTLPLTRYHNPLINDIGSYLRGLSFQQLSSREIIGALQTIGGARNYIAVVQISGGIGLNPQILGNGFGVNAQTESYLGYGDAGQLAARYDILGYRGEASIGTDGLNTQSYKSIT
jgi:hypothetical protein